VLEVWVGDERFDFDDDEVVTIGRAESCRVRIDDHRISRRHLEARCEDGYWRLVDLGSANGTFASGRRIQDVELRQALDVALADPDSGIHVQLSPQGSTDTIQVDPPEGSAYAIRIGRARDNDVVLDDTLASRYHAELIPRGARAEIRDCGSANGTRVNGAPVDRAEVAPGDLVEIGDTTLRVIQASNRLILEVVAQGATQHGNQTGRSNTPTSTTPTEALPSVTERERELLALVAGGASDKEIAGALFISVTTVRSHLDRIQQKTGRRKRADLTRLAFELGIQPQSAASYTG
jgi:pSer/pThr/pTyr-binding forkhead associated (FHA) protein/DNA-binding CsgD family transcriptional regulator